MEPSYKWQKHHAVMFEGHKVSLGMWDPRKVNHAARTTNQH